MITNYKHLEIAQSIGEPTFAEIEAIEAKLGAKLPAEFVEFLKVANGGYMPGSVGVVVGEDGVIEIMDYSSIFKTRGEHSISEDYTFIGKLESEQRHNEIPPGVLPIAMDGGSSILYLDLTTEGGGRIVAYVEGLPAWAGSNGVSGFFEVARSFDEYIEKLYIDSPDEYLKDFR